METFLTAGSANRPDTVSLKADLVSCQYRRMAAIAASPGMHCRSAGYT